MKHLDILAIADALAEALPPAVLSPPLVRPIVELACAWALDDMRRGARIGSASQLAAAIRDRAANHIQPAIDGVPSSAFNPGSPLDKATQATAALIWARFIARPDLTDQGGGAAVVPLKPKGGLRHARTLVGGE